MRFNRSASGLPPHDDSALVDRVLINAQFSPQADAIGSEKTQFPRSHTAVSGRRYYNPSQGRFLGRDPIEEQGGLNLYGFCSNDGVNLWDYLGEDVVFSNVTDQAWVDRFNADLQGLAGAGAVGQMLYNAVTGSSFTLFVDFVPSDNARVIDAPTGSTNVGFINLNPNDPLWIGTRSDPEGSLAGIATGLGLTDSSQRSVLTALGQLPPSSIVTIAHEIGHTLGFEDNGSSTDNWAIGNISLIENAVRNALGFDDRKEYYNTTTIAPNALGLQLLANAMADYGTAPSPASPPLLLNIITDPAAFATFTDMYNKAINKVYENMKYTGGFVGGSQIISGTSRIAAATAGGGAASQAASVAAMQKLFSAQGKAR